MSRRPVGVRVVVTLCAVVYTGVLAWALIDGRVSRLSKSDAIAVTGFGGMLWTAAAAARGGSGAARAARARFGANRAALVGLVILIAMAGVAVLAPVLSGDPVQMGTPSLERYTPPGGEHPLGTDRFGRDLWARVAHGGRASFALCALSILIALGLGTIVGAVAGVVRGPVDDIIMRAVDGMLAFPRLVLLITIVAFAPPGVLTLGLAVAATSWMGIARIVQSEVRRTRARAFAEAAVASGVGTARLVTRHLLPNAVGHVIVAATLGAGTVILLESSLSFLGLGVQPPTPSWGMMVFEGRDAIVTAWWASAFPAAAITLTVVGLNLVGDGLRDALDVRAG